MSTVAHVLRDWKLMKGRSHLEKKLNAFLCHSLVGTIDIPSDECYSYAKSILKMVKNTPFENRRVEVYTILSESFNQGTDANGVTVENLGNEQSINSTADGIVAILAIEFPPIS